ncbi:DnaA regulatory inactivator Hda [Betaproteobacteria bacterium]|nr:DnaA regulatory inactivator Hda [Betaproteobacteria bacterium]GHU09406.1 DnaA regulatory inactivator Hda [Betaproteobacteria bacterium]GHU25327.1 DnaA regulatory inactivator Hda [Betaproteobacteria bacterium]GHU32654.1 DnaA regulatory inactivator Hda [Betaproteobacteria bacterium]
MKQLLLDLHPERPPTFDNFVPGANAELLATLNRLAEGAAPGGAQCLTSPPPPPVHLYLWGAPGSGRSHLLQATITRAQALGHPAITLAASELESAQLDTPAALIAIDDADRLAPQAQIALFNAFNRARPSGQTLLLAGPVAPLHLAVREDLRTRIGQSLIFEVRPLDDDTRAAILRSLATRRGLTLADEVVAFVLNHGHRDLPGMVATFEALDAASLEYKRPITLPLVRELMQQGLQL